MLSIVASVKWEKEASSAVKDLKAFQKAKAFKTGYWISAYLSHNTEVI